MMHPYNAMTWVALSLALVGCGSSLLTTPPGFVELDTDYSEYDYRATSADGLVVAARSLDHDPKGSIEFWVRAIENEMRNRGGYALLGIKDVRTKQGVKGKRLEFGHDESNKPHLYYVALYVTEDELFLVEAGGTKELMTENEKQVELALTSLKTD